MVVFCACVFAHAHVATATGTGAIKQTAYTPLTVYRFAHPDATTSASNVTTWIVANDSVCHDRYNNVLFGTVDLAEGTYKRGACIAKNTTVDTHEWVGSFNQATGSGDSETGRMLYCLVLERIG